jgi:hypothetical protein
MTVPPACLGNMGLKPADKKSDPADHPRRKPINFEAFRPGRLSFDM